MSAHAERWSRPDTRLVAVALAAGLFLVSWGLIHRGFYHGHEIVDTGTYRAYGEAMRHGQVPYRDFAVEYPPGALPVFLAPAYASDYDSAFAWLMAGLGVCALACVALVRVRAAAFVAVAPLLVGALLLSRFDLWPAALTAAAVAALVRDRHRIGWAFLGAAIAAKLYPAVLVPLALVWTARLARLRHALAGAVVLAVVVLPFVAVAPGGVWRSVHGQVSRPLQVESLGAALLTTFGRPHVVTSHGSQNVSGHGAVGVAFAAVQLAVLLALWVAFARGPADDARFLRYAAACVAAFVALGKVLSPQFLVWLVPLVPLVRGRRGLAATALLAVALVLTQVWFPSRYWDYANHLRLAWVVLLRDVVLLALLAVLALRVRLREGRA